MVDGIPGDHRTEGNVPGEFHTASVTPRERRRKERKTCERTERSEDNDESEEAKEYDGTTQTNRLTSPTKTCKKRSVSILQSA